MSKSLIPHPDRAQGLIDSAKRSAGKIWVGTIIGAAGMVFLPTVTMVAVGGYGALKLIGFLSRGKKT